MKVFSCVIAVFFVVSQVSGISHEQFDESAWMDTQGRDKYFEYTDVSSLDAKPRSYSNNIDVVEFELPKKLVRTQLMHQPTDNLSNFCHSAIKSSCQAAHECHRFVLQYNQEGCEFKRNH